MAQLYSILPPVKHSVLLTVRDQSSQMQRHHQKRKSHPMTYEFRVYPRETNLLPSLTYLLLMSNSIGTIFRAYSSGHSRLLAFIFFICPACFLLEYCFCAYHRLPQHDKSARKKFLAVAIWCLFTAIMFGFTYQFAPLFSLAAATPLYAVAFAASAFMFYVYIIHVDVEECCNDNNRFSGGNFEIIFDKV